LRYHLSLSLSSFNSAGVRNVFRSLFTAAFTGL
jgi:hypothetical protein